MEKQLEDEDTFGFVLNFRTQQFDIPFHIKFLDDMFDRSVSTSLTRILLGFLLIIGWCLYTIYLLLNRPLDARFLGVPMIFLAIGVVALLLQQIMIVDNYGSLNSVGFLLIKSFIHQKQNKQGQYKFEGGCDVQYIDKKGLLHFENGDMGIVYKVDGQISPIAFKSEIKQHFLNRLAFEKSRNISTMETTISCSEQQDATNQILNLQRQMKLNSDRKGMYDYLSIQKNYVKNYINQKVSVTQQYIMFRNKKASELMEVIERLRSAQLQSRLFNTCKPLSKPEALKLFGDINNLN